MWGVKSVKQRASWSAVVLTLKILRCCATIFEFCLKQNREKPTPWIYNIIIIVHKKTCNYKESQSSIFPHFASGAIVHLHWEGNQPTLRGEDWLKDPFSLPEMRKLIGSIFVLSWDCHFLPFWPVHETVDSYRNQGEEEQTQTLVSGRLEVLGLKRGLWNRGGVQQLLQAARQAVRKDWKSHQQATRLAKNMGGRRAKSPNKWIYMMWSLSYVLRGRVNAT